MSSKRPIPSEPARDGEFEPVIERLKVALGVVSDARLAEMLGLSGTAFAKSKSQRLLPSDEIYSLCLNHYISLPWVVSGRGLACHADMSWNFLEAATASVAFLLAERSLVPVDIEAVLNLMAYVANAAAIEHKVALALLPKPRFKLLIDGRLQVVSSTPAANRSGFTQ